MEKKSKCQPDSTVLPSKVDGTTARTVAMQVSALGITGCGGLLDDGKKSSKGSETSALPGESNQAMVYAEQLAEIRSSLVNSRIAPGTMPKQMHDESAARFLAQATFGATLEDVEEVKRLWRTGWLENQFSIEPQISHWDLVRRYQSQIAPIEGTWDQAIWEIYCTSHDQLRKRIGFALSQIMVVSVAGLIGGGGDRALCMAAYMDWLEQGAFGNFRDLLKNVTLSPAMGYYLSTMNNRKAEYGPDGIPIRVPDENYAREIMQLFTIGTVELELDGRPKLQGGRPKETYSLEDVENLARVFTGWYVGGVSVGIDRWNKPMQHMPSRHSLEEKKFLGAIIPAGTDGPKSLEMALDTLFHHPNVGPFLGRQLIQRLVTSNPSRDYIRRVAEKFNDNGAGTRGDMKAVITQVFLDPEAMVNMTIADRPINWGKLREPVIRFSQILRLLGARSSQIGAAWHIRATNDPASSLGQSPGRAPSVFNFFEPNFVPAESIFHETGTVAPEMQLINEVSIAAIPNFIGEFINSPMMGRITFDFSPYSEIATDPVKLVETLDILLSGGSLSRETRRSIESALTQLPSSSAVSDSARQRIVAALWLIISSPEYLVQR